MDPNAPGVIAVVGGTGDLGGAIARQLVRAGMRVTLGSRSEERAGLPGLHAGPPVNSAAAEALTSVLIFLNKTYSIQGAGIRITGL